MNGGPTARDALRCVPGGARRERPPGLAAALHASSRCGSPPVCRAPGAPGGAGRPALPVRTAGTAVRRRFRGVEGVADHHSSAYCSRYTKSCDVGYSATAPGPSEWER
ncbi:hypothetical protein GCM10027440_00250 [Nocardiopsis coralliicola]